MENRPNPAQVKEGYVCLFPRCDAKPFGRGADLSRHQLNTHVTPKTFECPVIGCNRKGENPVKRLDKFREHLREVHNEADVLQCPVGCGINPATIIEIQKHLTYEHTPREVFPVFNTVRSWGLDTSVACPLEKCNKTLPYPHAVYVAYRHHGDLFERAQLQSILPGDRNYDIFNATFDCPIASCTWHGELYVLTDHVATHNSQEVGLVNDYFQRLGQHTPPVLIGNWVNGSRHKFPLAEVEAQCEKLYANQPIPDYFKALIQAMSGRERWLPYNHL
ncbi:MAG: hypothetical protein M1829_000757 [Trizodia sp. TS-e1964]|nr:MAG: hypothetical protein M1829_000757 [Trizodia sp. TS-e1964]